MEMAGLISYGCIRVILMDQKAVRTAPWLHLPADPLQRRNGERG